MATPAANIPANLFPAFHKQFFVDKRPLPDRNNSINSIYGFPVMQNTNDYFGTQSLANSEDAFISENDQTIRPHTKLFVKYFQKFDKEYNQNVDSLKKYSAEWVRKKFVSSLSYFLTLNPDALSIEISEDATLFYTIKKNNFTFYIDQYIDSEDNVDEEFVLTTFNKNEMGITKSGNILSILHSIRFTANC